MVPPGAPQPPQALQLIVGSPCGPSPPAPLWLCSMKGNLVASCGSVWVSLGRCSSKLGETLGEERSTWPPLWLLWGWKASVSQPGAPSESRVIAVAAGCSLCPLTACPAL